MKITTKEYFTLSDLEKERLIGKHVMGWEMESEIDANSIYSKNSRTAYYQRERSDGVLAYFARQLPEFADDLRTWFEVERQLQNLGKIEEYLKFLDKVTFEYPNLFPRPTKEQKTLRIACACPSQRLMAALFAVGILVESELEAAIKGNWES